MTDQINQTESSTQQKKKRAKKGTGIMYFTQDTEDAIVEYISTDSRKTREMLFTTRIKPAVDKLVENIFNTFKFTYFDVEPAVIQQEVVGFVAANLHKFTPGKGKAYSYFGQCVKNYLIHLNNGNYKRFQQHEQIDLYGDEERGDLNRDPGKGDRNELTDDYIKLIISYWDIYAELIFDSARDVQIVNAVVEILSRSKTIEIFNKKALYLFIREMTGCKTNQITKVINEMNDVQRQLLQLYLKNGYVQF